MIRAAFLLLTALLLSACAGHAPDSSRPTAWLKPGVKVTLPPPGIRPAFQQQQYEKQLRKIGEAVKYKPPRKQIEEKYFRR